VRANSLVGGQVGAVKARPKPFDAMNGVVANLLLNMTSSSRFEGSLNVDVNEITTNLVPFPRLHYLVASQSPLYSLADMHMPPRRLDQLFSDVIGYSMLTLIFMKQKNFTRPHPRKFQRPSSN
jgi:tubulin epsilon